MVGLATINRQRVRNGEIGKVFAVGYMAVPGAVKRGLNYLGLGKQLDKVVNKTICDM
jgi:hypothetical protein